MEYRRLPEFVDEGGSWSYSTIVRSAVSEKTEVQ